MPGGGLMPKVNMKEFAREQELVEDQECILHQARYQACTDCGRRFCVKCDSVTYPFPKDGEVRCMDCRQLRHADEVFRATLRNAEVGEREIASGNVSALDALNAEPLDGYDDLGRVDSDYDYGRGEA